MNKKTTNEQELKHDIKSINEQELKQLQISKVIRLGREQEYLTHAQINDFLPNIVDTENFDVIIQMLEDMSIRVLEKPPNDDEFTMLITTEDLDDDDAKQAAARFLAPCTLTF